MNKRSILSFLAVAALCVPAPALFAETETAGRVPESGVSADAAAAPELDVAALRAATEQCEAESIRWFGVCCMDGLGVPENLDEAEKWLAQACELGTEYADVGLTELAEIRASRGDAEAAARLWRLAAEHGNAEAQFRLGESLFNGAGVPEDKAEGRTWILRAAENGSERARAVLLKMKADAEE